MKAKKLRVLKNDVLVFHLNSTIDKKNVNTYKCFSGSYIIRKQKYSSKLTRVYFSDMNLLNWNPYKSFPSYDSPYDIVKQWLNENSNLEIRYMSDFPNIVAFERDLMPRAYNSIIKMMNK